jgi:GNAT superfamily N-acetyltransferase
MELKIATMDDFLSVMDMTLKFIDESPYKGMARDETKLTGIISDFINSKEKVVVLAVDDGQPVGIITGCVSEHMFSREKTAFELIWWIEPDKRGAKASLKLFEAFEYWARKMGCTYVQFGAAQETPYSDKVRKLYLRKGYTQTESNFLKAI